jgi:hypothetical protein
MARVDTTGRNSKEIALIPYLLLSLPVLFKHTIHPLANSSIHGIFTIINVGCWIENNSNNNNRWKCMKKGINRCDMYVRNRSEKKRFYVE